PICFHESKGRGTQRQEPEHPRITMGHHHRSNSLTGPPGTRSWCRTPH
ncbi:hypothetical protein CCACVL1_00857, partial [Corchorus capsularis]